jgi:two-component system response regulator YesN
MHIDLEVQKSTLLQLVHNIFDNENVSASIKDEIFNSIYNTYVQSKKYTSTEFMKVVNAYIQDHLSEDISLKCISAELYHSPSYFSRLFKRTAGVGFHSYVEQMKLKHAKLLLISTNMSIRDIAVAVGYESHTYFNRVFKKKYHISPYIYKKSPGNHSF